MTRPAGGMPIDPARVLLSSRAMPTDDDDDASASMHLLDGTMFEGAAADTPVRRYLLAKHRWLRDVAGWRHTIVAPGALPGASSAIDCSARALREHGGGSAAPQRRALARLIERAAPDIVEVGDASRLAWAALDAAQRLGVPSVAFVHDAAPAAAGDEGWPRAWLRRAQAASLRRLYAQFDLVLARTDAMVRSLRDLGAPRVQRQELGIDGGVFHPGRRDPLLRASLQLPRDARLLLFTGAAQASPAPIDDALRRLGPRYRLLVSGDGAPRGRQVVGLPHAPRSDSELARLLASVDAVIDTDTAGDGGTVLQALACGTAAVVSAGTAGARFVGSGGAGTAVHSPRGEDWAEAIAALFAGSPEALASAARTRAAQFDWNVLMPALLRRYRRLLLGSRPALAPGREPSFGEITQPAVSWHAHVGAPGAAGSDLVT